MAENVGELGNSWNVRRHESQASAHHRLKTLREIGAELSFENAETSLLGYKQKKGVKKSDNSGVGTSY